MKCPNCSKNVLGIFIKWKRGKTFCPHCENEIIVHSKNEYYLVVMCMLIFWPILFHEYSYQLFNIHGQFWLYIALYSLIIFGGGFFLKKRNVVWVVGNEKLHETSPSEDFSLKTFLKFSNNKKIAVLFIFTIELVFIFILWRWVYQQWFCC